MERQGVQITNHMSQSDGKSDVRIGLIGCGRVAEFGYLPAFRQARGIVLVGIADVNPSRCRALAPDIPGYGSIQSLIQAGGFDALVISVPTRFHLDYARCAAEAGLPSLVEKPPGVDVQEAKVLRSLEPAPWIGFNRRFEPDLITLKYAVPKTQGFQVRLELHYRRTTWKPFDMHDDALLDLGPHLIDLTRWLTGSEVRSVRTLSLKEQCAEFELDLTRGRAVVVCSTNRPYRERMEITEENGRLLASHRRGGIVSGIMAKLRPKGENPLVSSLVGQLEAFGQAVRGCSDVSLGSAADGVAVMSVIEAVRLSAADRSAPISVK
ncbi:MAG: Gfo/Idh/MocA family oxidoreductase [Nitrospirota bacterium]